MMSNCIKSKDNTWTTCVSNWLASVAALVICSVLGSLLGSFIGLVVSGELGGMVVFAALFTVVGQCFYPESEAAIRWIRNLPKVPISEH